ncbi:MAG TPA: type III ribulose-bisphosphate carboxylase [Candidatus Pacearchaeota archaeon]|nr:ribulose-1,5-bisphosphate carboxylase/oxygenase large subunit [archaeon BMS3Abin17]HDK41797.1 type III ribulose-bisphosphate carboxylase [Candidatus Pacearchaeota archaeon]HDZ60673.1 type III ribulose-bisphosphate carboxylase [Candidatus Pacearchaeota archaeon]
MTKEKFDFIELKYKPKNDLVCLFKVKPARGLSMKKAADTVALESSVGTWTEIKARDYVNKIKAKVFSIKGDYVKIAYPQELFEYDNVPNILSSIAGNIFGMKAVKSIRLQDVSFPKAILKSFKGPRYGIKGVRKFMKIKSRPLVGTIIKPKLGLNTRHHAQSAYESWIGGCDIVKDDENLASQKFNVFEERIARTLEKAHQAEEETGERKAYLVNVTAETKEMIKRAQLVQDLGGKYVMIDILTAGWAALQTLREANFKMAIHAHRAMHAAFDRNPDHGMSMIVIGDFARLIGVDQLHIGTGIGKLEGKIQSIKELEEDIEKMSVKETKLRLEQKWHNIKPTLGVSSGGLHPGHVPFLIKNLGKDLVIQAGGGIHGHPQGSTAGAKAMRQAVEAVLKKKSLKEYSKTHEELKQALQKWKK